MDKNEIIPYVEPIFRFCYKRLSNRHDAEDLAGEIIYHVLIGMSKYPIHSLEAWVWRIAHNRYARWIDRQNKSPIVLTGEDVIFDVADGSYVDEDTDEEQFETVFRYLHTLSSEYKNLFVDYYLGELPIKRLAEKYSLPESTVKWRLNVGRQKIRDRIGENKMDKVYQRINWNTTVCNGSMDPDRYLHTQIARAICLATYEAPLTVEEISLKTGIPTMYLEDELPRLEYGDAVCKVGKKYATNFILFRQKDRKQTEALSAHTIHTLADRLEELLRAAEDKLCTVDFYGNCFGIGRLGYILLPFLLKQKLRYVKEHRLQLVSGPCPPRKDGGYGWFIVEETEDETEVFADNRSGCNVTVEEDRCSRIYYYWIRKYFDYSIYERGTRRMSELGISQSIQNGTIPQNAISDEDAANFIASNLITRTDSGYLLNFPVFTKEQFEAFASLVDFDDEQMDDCLAEWITSVRRSFETFVPKRLYDQINPWLGTYLYQIVGPVTEELIRRGTLVAPTPDIPMTNGVFLIKGNPVTT